MPARRARDNWRARCARELFASTNDWAQVLRALPAAGCDVQPIALVRLLLSPYAMLVSRLPVGLAPLAELACDMRWLARPECRRLFASIDETLFRECAENPIDLLLEAPPAALAERARDPCRGQCER